MLYGHGKHTYELVDEWARLPEGWYFDDASGLAIDSQDNVYILTRGKHPVMIFDRDGNFLNSWGEDYFHRAHGICIGLDGSIYCADNVLHTVSKFTSEGKMIMELGNSGNPSDTGFVHTGSSYTAQLHTIRRGGPPFNIPTGVALSSSGEIYVADGYGNARIHKFTADGNLMFSWGEPGGAPGQFRIPHCVRVDKQDHVWVADRENNRIQIFNAQGEFLNQWTNLIRPNDIFFDDNESVYVSGLDLQLKIFSSAGDLLASWGSQGRDKDTAIFLAPHVIAVDSCGDIYVGEVAKAFAGVDRGSRAVLKFTKRD